MDLLNKANFYTHININVTVKHPPVKPLTDMGKNICTCTYITKSFCSCLFLRSCNQCATEATRVETAGALPDTQSGAGSI